MATVVDQKVKQCKIPSVQMRNRTVTQRATVIPRRARRGV